MIAFLVVFWLLTPDGPLTDARRALEAGDLSEAKDVLHRHWPASVGPDLTEALRLRRRVAYRSQDFDLAFALIDEEVALRRVLHGNICPVDHGLCDALEAGFNLALRHPKTSFGARSATWLARYEDDCASHPQETSRYHYMRGLSAVDVGDLALAWDEFWSARVLAERQSDLLDRVNAESQLALLAARFGRPQLLPSTASDTFSNPRATAPDDHDALRQGSVVTASLVNIAWSALLMREAGYKVHVNPAKILSQALDLASTPGPGVNAEQAANVRVNLALHAVQERDPEAALTWLRGIPALLKLSPEEQLWRVAVEARAHILLGDWEHARTALDAVEHWAATMGDLESRWMAASLHAAFYEARAENELALMHYQAADSILDSLVVPIALGQLRDHFIHDLQRSARRMISLELRMGRVAEALCTTRLARGRVQRALMAVSHARATRAAYEHLRTKIDDAMLRCYVSRGPALRAACAAEVEARRRLQSRELLNFGLVDMSRARVGCEDLAPPAAGELLLAFVQLEAGWAAIAATNQMVRWVPLGEIDIQARPDVLSVALLGDFANELSRASRLLLLATDDLHRVDFHMLPWQGRPLVAHLPVAYGLDVPRTLPKARPTSRAAVVVVDESSTLGVDEEGLLIDSILDSAGHASEIYGPGEATRAAVMAAFDGGLGHAYFAGHGGALVATESGKFGKDLWDMALHLDQQTMISPEDLLVGLTPGQAPATVVLLACNTGLVNSRTLGGGVGLAQALLLRGSHVVLGTTEPIDDAVAHALGEELYEGWEPGARQALGDRLAAAQATLVGRGFLTTEVGKVRAFVR